MGSLRKLTHVALASLMLTGCASQSYLQNWVEVETRDVRIRTHLPRVYAEEFAERYQEARDAIATNEFGCAFERISGRVDVILMPGIYGEIFVGSYLSGFYFHPDEPMLDLNPSIVIRSDDEDRDSFLFLHELTHRLVDECVPSAPSWVHEGFATFYETAKVEGDELRVGYPAAVFSELDGDFAKLSNGDTVALVPLRDAPTFDQLRHADGWSFADDETNYYAAWVAVHLMKLEDETLGTRLRRYLGRLNNGDSEERAWRVAFDGIDIEKRYRDHLTADYQFLRYPVSLPSVEIEASVDMQPSDVALLLSIFYEWEDRRGAKAARYLVEAASESNPEAAAPHLYLASIYAARSKKRKARAALIEALAVAPTDPDVLAAGLRWFATLHPRGELTTDDQQQAEAWAHTLERSATTAFHFGALSDWRLVEGQESEALRLADAAIAIDDRNAAIRVAAAKAAAALGRIELARGHLKVALGLTDHSEQEIRDELRRRLDVLEGPP